MNHYKKTITFILSAILALPLFVKAAPVWVDKNGQKVEAEFIKANDTELTISFYGEEMVMPLDSLSPFSRALAIKMRNEAANGGGRQVPVWTDTQGRKIKAHFIKADASSITLDMEGNVFKLPLEMLDAQSMRQAFAMSQAGASSQSLGTAPEPRTSAASPPTAPVPSPKPSPQASKPPPPTAVVEAPAEKVPQSKPEVKGTDPNGPLDLTQPMVWVSSDGRPLSAIFKELKGNDISLQLTSGKDLTMPLEKFNDSSKTLARKLKALMDNESKKAAQALAKRKKMKLPSVTEQDLDKAHSLKNSEGNIVEAKFIEANDERVVISLASNSNRRIPLPWDKLSEESQALMEALRQLKKSMLPRTAAASGNKLPSFVNGSFAGYNSVINTDRFDVALKASPNGSGGVTVRIWLKSDDESLPPRRFDVNYHTHFTYRSIRKHPDGKIEREKDGTPKYRWPRSHRRITKFDTILEPSMDREKITLTGTFNNKGTFEYNMELNSKGLIFWSKMKEPKLPKPKTETDPVHTPTRLSFSIGIPGLISDAKNASVDKVKSIVGDAYLSLRPQSGKPQKYPFDVQWTVTKKKYAGEKSGALKSLTVEGFPYGDTKLTAIPFNTSGMNFGYGYSYGMVFPFQGLHFNYSGADERYRQEIPKSRGLKVLLTEVD